MSKPGACKNFSNWTRFNIALDCELEKFQPLQQLSFLSNGCIDTEPQNAKKVASKVEAVASKNNSEHENDMDVNPNVESEINGEQDNVVEPATSSKVVKQAVRSRKKKAAEAAEIENSETAVTEEGEGNSTAPLSKSKGRQNKDKKIKMEVAENTPDEPQISEEPKTEDAAPIQKTNASLKRKATPEPETDDKMETEIEPEAVEVAVPEKKSRKRKVTESAKPKTKKSAKEKPEKLVRTKTKRQKVLLSIPTVKPIPGKVFVIGENDVGQLGFGEEVEVKKRPAMLELPHSIVDIAAGGMHSACLTESGEVITFGCNDEGALGRVTSDEKDEATPSRVEIPERVIQISAGDSHTAALTESGQVYLWGNFRSGDGPMGLTADGVKQIKPIKILNGITIVKISSGTEHLACLSNEGVVYTCGCGENGQLGRFSERACRDGGRKGRSALLEPAAVSVTGHPNSKTGTVLIEDVWTGSYCTFLKAQQTGLIYVFGLNNYNHLGYENERVRFVPKQVASFNSKTWNQIAGGQHHTLALDSEGLVYSMGRKDYGRLGLGEDCEEKSVPTLLTTLENENCNNISCGNCVSFSVTKEGSVYSWGFGTNHQLGHGNDDDCHIPRLVEGNFINSWKAHKVSGGGQHTLILASTKESSSTNKKK
ncbi:regulator of chromosome condensation [Trichonephila inaurata madagascariensis]|uniref:Regulator of chromosome condensation n=1 Tax=Trichonephila inaurata madagascariensis TaxID=2747483 RepID=A0A8X6X996_9ARAC|nr:regulator of chromosome condensation [Trichonephila inaurata madagascariensis]